MRLVALPLAHPLTPKQAEQAGAADVRTYRAGETIILSPAGAMTVIRAGWAQVDPNDQAAVAAAMAVTPDDSAPAPAPAATASAAAPAVPPQARPPAAGASGN